MDPIPAPEDEYDLPRRYGSPLSHGVGGCLGGVALVAVAAVLLLYNIGIKRGFLKLTGGAAIGGLVLLCATFKVRGVELRADGVEFWTYVCWFLGKRQFIPAAEIRALVLGEEKGKFIVTLRFADGSEFQIPGKWATLKDAQALVNFGTNQYGAAADVAIEDAALLSEAANFAGAKRYTVTPYKASRAEGERLVVKDLSGGIAGEVKLLLGWFQGGIAEIAQGGTLEAMGVRWHLKKGGKVSVTDGELSTNSVEIKSSFTGSTRMLNWTDPEGTVWSAVFDTESDDRSPFTFKFYRGLTEDVGSKADREAVREAQGEPEFAAIANGDASSFTVDVADEESWPWVLIGLACAWMRFRPEFSFVKE